MSEPTPTNGNGTPVPRKRKRRRHILEPTTPYLVGEPLPNSMNGIQLMRALNLRPATFYQLLKLGKLKRFEFRNSVTKRRTFSGLKVTRYLAADLP